MRGPITAKRRGTAVAVGIALSTALYAAGAWATQSAVFDDAGYRDLSQFEFGPTTGSTYADPAASATAADVSGFGSSPALAREPSADDASAKNSRDTRAQTRRQPDKPPEAVPRYEDGVYLYKADYWRGYPLNLWRFVSAPARFDETDWLIAVLAGSTAAALVALDSEIRGFWQDKVTGGTSRDVFDVFDVFGEAKFQIPVIIGGYALAELSDQTGLANARRGKSAFILAAQSALLTQLLVHGIKFVSGRDRPDERNDITGFNGPGNGDNTAFPSGHASGAFAIAGTISEVYRHDHPWVPWVLYPIATGTALARVDRDKHWASDVFVGGMIGYLMAATVVRYSPFLERNDVSFRPMGVDGGSGVLLVKRF